jgi:putative transposase
LRPLIDTDHPQLSVRRQCALLGLTRSSYYYEPASESKENLAVMRLIDEEYTRHPFYGSRRMAVWLRQQGQEVNRKRVQRLMRLMNLEAIYPKPRLSAADRQHKVYPYLLRDVAIWYSRYVISWRLSNTLDGSFCLDMLEEALGQGQPEVFNTDQGVQFTAAAWTSRLERAGVAVSMDGKGRWADNVFVERLWRTVKYEDIYLNRYEVVPELQAGLKAYFPFYNEVRPHQALGDRTPAEVYGRRVAR